MAQDLRFYLGIDAGGTKTQALIADRTGCIRGVGRELGHNALAVVTHLRLVDRPFDLVMAGGLFRSGSQLLLESLPQPVRTSAPRVRPVSLRIAPVVGSVLLATQAAAGEVNADVCDRLTAEAMAKVELVA